MVQKYDHIVADINDSLDAIVRLGHKYNDFIPSTCLDKLNYARVTLATHYNDLPYETAARCKDRVELVEGIVRDILERQRIDHLTKRLDWKKNKKKHNRMPK